jgi:hypothetical protein
MEDQMAELSDRGFVWIQSTFLTAEEAFGVAGALIDGRREANGLVKLAVIGEFVLPPADGPPTREFQTLHFDFGLPVDPKVERDVARYTALHIPADVERVSAVTRLVPLVALLAQRTWPSSSEVLRGLIAYGHSHGAWDDADGYVEGSFARIVEAAAGGCPFLPSVKTDPAFLCGMEFDSLRSEVAFFEHHDLHLRDVEVEVALQPGELLVFDNLALAHGRRGARQPGELHQRVYGHRALRPASQCELRDQVLGGFTVRGSADGVLLASVFIP